ncbi:MAG: ferrous iron transport protein A [Planctomycetota bacterium]|nr:ferrous iron transport protein A [Planctomycetota bacterium]
MVFAKGVSDAASTTLASAPRRTAYSVDRVSGPDQRRLCEMGLIQGAIIQIVNRAQQDMMVVKVGGSRLALARGMADHVWVK